MANYKNLSASGIAENRKAPRLELMERIHGHLTSLDVKVVVREISLGGLSIEAPLYFPDGAVHEFRLTLGDGSKVIVRGRAAHSRPYTDEATGNATYVTGFEFVEDQTQAAPELGDLVDRVTARAVPVKLRKQNT
jgi:hypothetical protein